MNNEMLLVIFVGLTGFALLVQAIVMLVAFLTMRRTVMSLQSDVQELRSTVTPILTKSRETLERVAPKIESVANDVADLARRVNEQSVEFQAVAGEILDRVHRQTSRVDNMFTNVVDGVEHASNVVADSVTRPVRQISGVLAGAKAFFSVLATGRRPGERSRVVADQDMFV
jgi:methyl-accepting chemotaxis protein